MSEFCLKINISEATPSPPVHPAHPIASEKVVHEIKKEIKEEEPDEVVDDSMEVNNVPIVEEEQSEEDPDQVDSAKTDSDTDVSVVSEQVFDDENYEANMRAKGYGTDEMYSDWDDVSCYYFCLIREPHPLTSRSLSRHV